MARQRKGDKVCTILCRYGSQPISDHQKMSIGTVDVGHQRSQQGYSDENLPNQFIIRAHHVYSKHFIRYVCGDMIVLPLVVF